jgi:hypothetical protein
MFERVAWGDIVGTISVGASIRKALKKYILFYLLRLAK